MYDVIVVGGGPAGSAASKRCAENGLKTVMLEKRQLPRDKVCTGFMLGPVAKTLIKQEFGDLPKAVLAQPPTISGLMFHVPSFGSEKIERLCQVVRRRDFDYWMIRKAQDSGVELGEGAGVVSVNQQAQGFSVIIENGKGRQELFTKFVVGADGATSVVRSSLFPEFKVRYGQAYQEHFQGEIDIDKDYPHWFYSVELIPSVFYVHHRDGLTILSVGGGIGQMKQLMAWAKEYFAKYHHFDTTLKPIWKGECLEPVIFRELTSGIFQPAKGNALLVGDAGGLLIPFSREGVGVAVKTGLLAANSIRKAIDSGESASAIYLTEISGMISAYKEIYPWVRRMIDEARSGGHSLPRLLRDTYGSTIRMF